MSFIGKIKSVAVAAVFASIATVSSAATVATLDIYGAFSYGPTGVYAQGSFDFQNLGLDLYTETDYQINAYLNVGGYELIDDSVVINDTSVVGMVSDAASALNSVDPAIVPFLLGVGEIVATGDGTQHEILPGLYFAFEHDNVLSGPGGISGDFWTYVSDSMYPIFNRPDTKFYLSLELVDLAAVPLPASLPLLGMGVMGMAALRRRKRAA